MRRFMLSVAIAFGASGCSVDVPGTGDGVFSCDDESDCADGYYCRAKVCVKNGDFTGDNTPVSCTGINCPGNCSNRGLACQVISQTGVCANVRFSDGYVGLTCVPCPASCPNDCMEKPVEVKPPEEAVQCRGTAVTNRCTDVGCQCDNDDQCAPSLICRTQCVDPCKEGTCSTQQACSANHGSSLGFSCGNTCNPPLVNCWAAGMPPTTPGYRCDGGSNICKPDGTVLLVVAVSPSVQSRVAAAGLGQVRVAFNMGLKPSTVTSAAIYVKDESGNLPGTLSVDPAEPRRAVFVPNTPFLAGKLYTVIVSAGGGLTCDANMPLDRDFSYQFSTF